MHFLTLLTVLASASLAAATPIEKRQLGGVSPCQSSTPTYLPIYLRACLACLSPLLTQALPLPPVLKVLICTGAQSTGDCIHQVVAFGTCTNLTAPFLENAATFAPDGEEQYCYPYLYPCGGICKSPEGCTYGAVSYNTTAKNNLTAAGGWNKLIESFECYQGVAPIV